VFFEKSCYFLFLQPSGTLRMEERLEKAGSRLARAPARFLSDSPDHPLPLPTRFDHPYGNAIVLARLEWK
jgi:hypothetical protein